MKATEKFLRQTLATSYEFILEAGELETIKEIAPLGEKLRIYPHVLERAKELGVDLGMEPHDWVK